MCSVHKREEGKLNIRKIMLYAKWFKLSEYCTLTAQLLKNVKGSLADQNGSATFQFLLSVNKFRPKMNKGKSFGDFFGYKGI